MELTQVIEVVKAEIVAGKYHQTKVEKGFCSDLMSDVLTIDTDKMLLITGMANLQTIRTAEMADIQCILLVRDKKASGEMIQLAEENGMIILSSSFSMFKVAGLLYAAGLKPVY